MLTQFGHGNTYPPGWSTSIGINTDRLILLGFLAPLDELLCLEAASRLFLIVPGVRLAITSRRYWHRLTSKFVTPTALV